MPAADIKGILDAIIDGTNNKIPNEVNSTLHQNMGVQEPQTIDAGEFREKLSLYVLKDIICAMMHDETKDLDGMIDQSIMRHIHDDYGCSCYGYLCKANTALNSPILSDIIQEIDAKSMRVQSKVEDPDDSPENGDVDDLKKSLNEIENYEELRERLREIVSQKVVDDVANVITKSNDAPVFDTLDEKLEEKKIEPNIDETTNESTILKMTASIVCEGAMRGIKIPQDDAMEAAIIEYCLCEMDFLFKMDPTMKIRRGWDAEAPIQESFLEMVAEFADIPDEEFGYPIHESWSWDDLLHNPDDMKKEFEKHSEEMRKEFDDKKKAMEAEWEAEKQADAKSTKRFVIIAGIPLVASMVAVGGMIAKYIHDSKHPYTAITKILDEITKAADENNAKKLKKYLKKLTRKCYMLDQGYNWSKMPTGMLDAMRELKVAADGWLAAGPDDEKAQKNFAEKAKAFIEFGTGVQSKRSKK